MRPGANMHPIAGNVARKCRSAAWRCRRGFRFFSTKSRWQRGHWNPLCSFQGTPQRWGVVKGENHACGSGALACSGTSCASALMGLVVPCRGIITWYVADVEGTEMCFHVPATSLEALSANTRHCQDMEVLYATSTSAVWA